MRHIGFVNAILKVAPNVIINPNIFYTNQVRASELVLGMNAQFNLSESGRSSCWQVCITGTMMRLSQCWDFSYKM